MLNGESLSLIFKISGVNDNVVIVAISILVIAIAFSALVIATCMDYDDSVTICKAGLEGLDKYRSTGGNNSKHVLDVIDYHKASVLNYRNRIIPRFDKQASQRHVSLAFAFAEDALSIRCFDHAEKAYMDLIEFYPESVHCEIRDRAWIGIEHVRSWRQVIYA